MGTTLYRLSGPDGSDDYAIPAAAAAEFLRRSWQGEAGELTADAVADGLVSGGSWERNGWRLAELVPMRVAYACDGPGKFEACAPMGRYIWETDAFTDTDGDVESPTGWFGLAGRWIVREDDRGFVYSDRHESRDAAADAFGRLAEAFGDWLEPDDCATVGHDWQAPSWDGDRLVRYCDACGARDVVRYAGDLRDELADAERTAFLMERGQ